MTIKGIIESIEIDNANGHEKKVVTLSLGVWKNVFIEFRGQRMNLLNNLKQDDAVAVNASFNGKISKSTGIRYNNIIGLEIKKISSKLL